MKLSIRCIFVISFYKHFIRVLAPSFLCHELMTITVNQDGSRQLVRIIRFLIHYCFVMPGCVMMYHMSLGRNILYRTALLLCG